MILTRCELLCAMATFFAPLTHAMTRRNGWARETFRRGHPCPATGLTRGPCPGFVIDHDEPLCAGGADSPENMLWQAESHAATKDTLERDVCRAMSGN
jgi:hypothetical protein